MKRFFGKTPNHVFLTRKPILNQLFEITGSKNNFKKFKTF